MSALLEVAANQLLNQVEAMELAVQHQSQQEHHRQAMEALFPWLLVISGDAHVQASYRMSAQKYCQQQHVNKKYDNPPTNLLTCC